MPKLTLGYKDGEQKWFEGSLPSGWSKQPEKTDIDVNSMELEELHTIAKRLEKPMAANIGLENARKKVAAMLEGE